MKIPIFTDIQIHTYTRHDIDSSRLSFGLDCLNEIIIKAAKAEQRFLLFAGDLFDKPGYIPTEVVNRLLVMLKKTFKKYPKILVLAISGNHDQVTRNSWTKASISALEFLQTMFPKNFKIIDNQSFEIGVDGRQIGVHGIPYYAYAEHFMKALKARAKDTYPDHYNILMIHQTPRGIMDLHIPTDVDPNHKLFKAFDFVICGHIHWRQEIRKRFLIAGTPMHRDLADEGQKKGFIILDTWTGKWKFKKLKYPEYRRHKLPYPKDEHYYYPLIAKPEKQSKTKKQKFSTNNTPANLAVNYFKIAGNGKKALLDVGLKLIR